MNPFMKTKSIPVALLKQDFARRAIFLTKSHKTSGTFKSLEFLIFLIIEISKVGRELLFVMS
jgi:hypothetical protein